MRAKPIRAAVVVVALLVLGLIAGSPAVASEGSDGRGSPATTRPRCFGQRATIVARPGVTTIGSSGNDVIVGTAGDDLIFTGGSTNLVCAGGGNDSIYGGPGRDRVLGGLGNDLIFGGAGRDQLHAGPGRDRCVGGPSADTMRMCVQVSVPAPIRAVPKGPMVTFTFDDGNQAHPRIAAALLEARGFRGTFYLMSGFLDEDPYLDTREARWLHNAGHEIGGHSVSHPYLTLLTPAELHAELVESKATLESIIEQPVTAFAAPFGDYNAAVLDAIAASYTSNRSVLPGFNVRGAVVPYELLVRNVTAETPTSMVESWLDEARTQNAWVIFVYHDILDVPTTYDTTPAAIMAHIDAVARRALPVVTISEGLAIYGG